MCFSTRDAIEAAAAASYEPISCARIVSDEMMGLELIVNSDRADAYSSTCSPIFIFLVSYCFSDAQTRTPVAAVFPLLPCLLALRRMVVREE